MNDTTVFGYFSGYEASSDVKHMTLKIVKIHVASLKYFKIGKYVCLKYHSCSSF